MKKKDQEAIAKLYIESGEKNDYIHPNVQKQWDEENKEEERLKKIAEKYPNNDGEQFYKALISGEISYSDGYNMIVNLLRNNSGKNIVEWITGKSTPNEVDPVNRGNSTDYYY